MRTESKKASKKASKRSNNKNKRKTSLISALQRESLRAIRSLSILIYVLFIFLLSFSIPESPFTVFLGFLPVLFYLVITFYLLSVGRSIIQVLFILPIILSGLYYLAWSFQIFPELANMEGGILSIINLIVCYMFAMILSFVHPKSMGGGDDISSVVVDKVREVSKVANHEEISEKDVTLRIRGIEDKCKAINFVIGRVYSNKKGGSKESRSKITIPRELYNAFSELVEGERVVDKLKLLSIVENIYARLKRLEHPESELFELGDAKLEVNRANDGSDQVLEVLMRNDKDPIEDYYREAIEICQDVVKYLRKEANL